MMFCPMVLCILQNFGRRVIGNRRFGCGFYHHPSTAWRKTSLIPEVCHDESTTELPVPWDALFKLYQIRYDRILYCKILDFYILLWLLSGQFLSIHWLRWWESLIFSICLLFYFLIIVKFFEKKSNKKDGAIWKWVKSLLTMHMLTCNKNNYYKF